MAGLSLLLFCSHIWTPTLKVQQDAIRCELKLKVTSRRELREGQVYANILGRRSRSNNLDINRIWFDSLWKREQHCFSTLTQLYKNTSNKLIVEVKAGSVHTERPQLAPVGCAPKYFMSSIARKLLYILHWTRITFFMLWKAKRLYITIKKM